LVVFGVDDEHLLLMSLGRAIWGCAFLVPTEKAEAAMFFVGEKGCWGVFSHTSCGSQAAWASTNDDDIVDCLFDWKVHLED
jgi:hypothetical protein